MMTKKDYEMVAKAIAETDYKDTLVDRLSHDFKADNPNFDGYKFWRACYPKAETEG